MGHATAHLLCFRRLGVAFEDATRQVEGARQVAAIPLGLLAHVDERGRLDEVFRTVTGGV